MVRQHRCVFVCRARYPASFQLATVVGPDVGLAKFSSREARDAALVEVRIVLCICLPASLACTLAACCGGAILQLAYVLALLAWPCWPGL